VKIWEKGDLCATFNGTSVVLFDDLQLRKTGTSSSPDMYFNDAGRDPGVHHNLDNGADGWGWSANNFELGYWTEDDQDLHITNSIRVAGVEAGTGIFYTYLTVADEVYGAGWNGSLEVPTKNAVYDKINAIVENVSTTLEAGTVTATTYGITSDGGANDIILPEADTDVAGLLGADKWDEIVANSLKATNVPTALEAGTVNATTYGITSDSGANDIVLPEATTDVAGLLGADKWDEIVASTVHKTSTGADHSYLDQAVTIAGTPTFSTLTVDEEAYDEGGWDGDSTVPTKNAVRDKIETMGGGATNTARNLIVNGAAMVNQRGPCTATNTYFSNGDFVWCLDHVLLVSDGADAVDVLQNTAEIPAGASHCFELDTETSNVKFGLLFPLESLVAAELLSPDDDRVCSITFKYKATAGVQNIRAQVLSFTGTVDALVDPINSWVAGTADSDPTYVASWTPENAGAQIATTTEWQTYTLENVAIDTAGTNNVALLIHVADIDLLAGTDKIYIADVHINEGATASAYVRPTLRIEFDECARFMMKSFEQAVTPDTDTSDFDGTLAIMNSNGTNDDDFIYQVRFPAPMHHQPDVTYFSPGEDSADWWNENDGNSDGPATTIDRCATSFISHAGSATATPGERYHIHYVAISEIIAS
jgi:hypothetical protein